jgi:hypothetical protein
VICLKIQGKILEPAEGLDVVRERRKKKDFSFDQFN